MTKRNCQNCEQVIGNLEESYTYYGQVICKACKIKLENQFGDPGTTNGNIETEIPIEEVQIEQDQDMKDQTLPAEDQAIADFKKDAEHFEDKDSSGEDSNNLTKKVVMELGGRVSKKCTINLDKEAACLPPLKQESLNETSESVERSTSKKMGYIRKHWRGEFSLAVSFWINVFLFNCMISLFLAFLFWNEPIKNPVTYARVVISFLVFVLAIVYPWQIIGLWRSCNRHIETSSKRFWARTAQVLVVLGFISTLGNLASSWPMYQDLLRLGFGEDEDGNYSLKLEKNNTLIHLQGGLGFGVSKEVGQLLRKYPEVKGIILDSYGGRIYEGRELSKLISAYDLDTYSLEGCYSAATTAFISGRKRFLGIGANLAFHQYRMDYESFDALIDIEEEQAKDLLLFQQQGVKSEFLDRIFYTDHDDLWYPTVDEMLDAGVIHGIVNTSDLLPVEYVSISKEIVETDEVLLDIPFYKIIRKYEPEIYRKIKAELAEQIKKGASLFDLQRAGANILEPLATSLMPRTSDEALIQFYQIVLVGLTKLKEIDPMLCLKAIYPKQYGSVSLSQYLSNDEITSMLDTFSRIIIDAHEKDNPVVDADAAELVLDSLLIELGEHASYLELGSLQNTNDYERHCNAVIKFYEMIIVKDKAEACNLLRYLMSPEIGTEDKESPGGTDKPVSNDPSKNLNDLAIIADKWLEVDHDSDDAQEN